MDKSALHPFVDGELASRFALEVMDLFQADQSLVQVKAAAKRAFHWAEYCLDLLETANPLPQPPACQAGCTFCCYNQVELTAPEALLLGDFLQARFSPEKLRLLLERVARSLNRRAGQSKVNVAAIRAELSCPLLKDGFCSVYEVRPLMCRAMHSLEAEACRRELADPTLSVVEFYGHRQVIHVSLSQGLIDVCLALGYQPGPVDLAQAIQDYFSQPDLVSPWLDGRRVFHT